MSIDTLRDRFPRLGIYASLQDAVAAETGRIAAECQALRRAMMDKDDEKNDAKERTSDSAINS